MAKQTRKPRNRKIEGLMVGDDVEYVIETSSGPVERAGQILMMDAGDWCMVKTKTDYIWIRLRQL